MNETLIVALITGCLCTIAGFIMAYMIFYFQEKKAIEREERIKENIVKYLSEKNKRGK